MVVVFIFFIFGYFELCVYIMILLIKSVFLYYICVYLFFYGISLILMNSNESINVRVMNVNFLYGNG